MIVGPCGAAIVIDLVQEREFRVIIRIRDDGSTQLACATRVCRTINTKVKFTGRVAGKIVAAARYATAAVGTQISASDVSATDGAAGEQRNNGQNGRQGLHGRCTPKQENHTQLEIADACSCSGPPPSRSHREQARRRYRCFNRRAISVNYHRDIFWPFPEILRLP
jgi:hypothetical protein